MTWVSASYAMEAQILRPLLWFALLEHWEDKSNADRFKRRHYRKAPLFDRPDF